LYNVYNMEKNLTNYLGKILTICQGNEITSIKTPDILDVLDKLLIVQLSPIAVGLLTQAKVPLLGLFKELAKFMGKNVTKFTSNNEIYYEAEVFTSIDAFKKFLEEHLLNDIFTDSEIQDILDDFNDAGGSALKISIEKMSGGQRGGEEPWSRHILYFSICFSFILLVYKALPPEVPKSNSTTWSWDSISSQLPEFTDWFQRPTAANETSSVSSANETSPECSTYPSYAELEILRLLSQQNASGNQQYLQSQQQSQQQQQTYDTLLAEAKLLKEALGIITSNLGAMNSTIFRTAGDIKRIPGDFADIRLRVSDLQSNIADDIQLLMNVTKTGILPINATSANVTSIANLPSANVTSIANLPSEVEKVEECIAPNKMVPALKDANKKLVDLQKRVALRTGEVEAIKLLYGKATEQLERKQKENVDLTIEVATCNAMLENATSSATSSASPSASASSSSSVPLNNTSASEVINATGDYTMAIIFGVLIAGLGGGYIWKTKSQNKELQSKIDAEIAKKAQTKAKGATTRQANQRAIQGEPRLDSASANLGKSYSVPREGSDPSGRVLRNITKGTMYDTLPDTDVTYQYPKGGNDSNKSRIGGKRRTRKHKKYVTKRRQLRKIRRTGKKRHRNSKKFRINK
jgi:hypothetical protein